MIPRRFHFIWLGDAAARPDQYLGTWRRHHPEHEFRVWDSSDLAARPWRNAAQMNRCAAHDPAGVVDLMRWEILLDEGGVVVDANSICLQRLPDWLFECEMFAAWENELARPGLISTGVVGSMRDNPFLAGLVEELRGDANLAALPAWQATGPRRLTESHRRQGYANLTVVPSHFFLPSHYTGVAYCGTGPVYAEQCWAAPADKTT